MLSNDVKFGKADSDLVTHLDNVLSTEHLAGTPLGTFMLFVLSAAPDRNKADAAYIQFRAVLGKNLPKPTDAEPVRKLSDEVVKTLSGVDIPELNPADRQEWLRHAMEGVVHAFDTKVLADTSRCNTDYDAVSSAGLSKGPAALRLFGPDGIRMFSEALASVPLMYGFTNAKLPDNPARPTVDRVASDIAAAAGGKPAEYAARIMQYAFLTGGTPGGSPGVDKAVVEGICNEISTCGDKAAVGKALIGGCGPWDSAGSLPNCPPWASLKDTVPALNAALSAAPATAPAPPTAPGPAPAPSSPAAPAAPAAPASPGDSGSAPVSGMKIDPSAIGTLDYRTAELLEHMAYDEDQLKEALDSIEYLDGSSFPFLPYLTSYHPGTTETAVAKLLDGFTARASHRNYRLSRGEPGDRKTVMIPPAFKVDAAPAIWTRAVITGMGFPFINFTCPSVAELLRGTDPARVRLAYKNVKAMFKQCGLKKPIDTLKEFARAQYRNCALNALTVDADELYSADPGTTVTASVIDPYSKVASVKGSMPLSMDFLTMFYTVLSPVNAIRQYSEVCGLEPKDYMAYLSHYGKPPVYILNPKRVQFRRGPRGGLFHRLFSSKTAPVLVRARVNGHDGGLLVPEKVADLIFCE